MKIHAHPPERRRRGTVLAAHGCCCCCCCCLHSLGGLIGAAVGGAKISHPEGRRTVRVYWLSLLASVVLGFAGFSIQENPGVAVLAVLLGMPAAQLNASFFTLIAHMFAPLDLRALGLITWKAFLWAFIGAAVMIVPFVVLSYF